MKVAARKAALLVVVYGILVHFEQAQQRCNETVGVQDAHGPALGLQRGDDVGKLSRAHEVDALQPGHVDVYVLAIRGISHAGKGATFSALSPPTSTSIPPSPSPLAYFPP